MHLFWLVFKDGKDLSVIIQPAGAIIAARIRALLTGVEGEFQEGHELDAKTAKKVPKAMIGRVVVTQRGDGSFEEPSMTNFRLPIRSVELFHSHAKGLDGPI
jgi:hypothetical protein